jgi:sigma-E factor negative regulatory protein RseA
VRNDLEPMMKDGSPTRDTHRTDERLQALSSLMDGAAAPADAARACSAWREASEARAAWHAYHVIGDVLRSDELGGRACDDARLLLALRERLAQEPALVAPQPTASGDASTRRRGWAAPMAVAAGFVAVVGVLVVTRVSVPPASAPQLALAPVSSPQTLASSAVPVAVADSFAEPQVVVANGKLIRDVRLDQYLAAHKQFGGSSALGVPSGFLRGATYDVSTR